jgi:cell division protein FtsB
MTNEPLISKEVQDILNRMIQRTDAWVEKQQERNARLKRENAEIDKRIAKERMMREKRIAERAKKILRSSH